MSKLWDASRLWVWRGVKIVVVASVIAGFVYWVKFAPVSVATHKVERGAIVSEVMGTGTLEARVGTTVSPKISGRIGTVLVDQGDRVSAGDSLVQLDDEELQQQVAIAQANVEAAVAAIERLKTDRNRATAVLAQAQKSYARNEKLSQQKAVSQDELDRATEALAISVVGVSRSEAGITEGQKELVAAEKTLEYHRARLKDTQVNAPFDGMIVKRSREPGDVVVPGSSILTLISTEQLWINAWVDETEMSGLKPGQDARVIFRSESDSSLPGKLVRLGKETDRETREFIVDVEILKLPTNWAVGQCAEVFIETQRKTDVVLLPGRFVDSSGEQKGVFLNQNGVVGWQAVELGLHGREWVEVTSGLQAGQTVIRPDAPGQQLRSGQRTAAQ